MDQPITFGSSTGLHFVLKWHSGESPKTSADATRGVLSAYVGERLVWGEAQTQASEGISWTWVELIEHLAAVWSRIEWEESDPFGLNCPPDRLRLEAEQRWEHVSASVREREEQLLWGYEETHNLASGLSGIWPSSLWIQREGSLALVVGNDTRVLQPANEVYETLAKLGDAIAERLRTVNDARARTALKSWNQRHAVPIEDLVSISTGISKESILKLSQGNIKSNWELDDDFLPNELVAVARMIGSTLPIEDLGKVLISIRKLPRRHSEFFDEWSANISDAGFDSIPAWMQGVSIAKQFRAILKNPVDPIDPEEIMKGANVPVRNMVLPTDQLNALCCWGPKHGPVVFVNKNGKHSQQIRGRRSSLAHEICHLLMDRNGGLPLGEVFGGKVPGHLESRANRFASEFLMPMKVAGNAFLESNNDKKTLDHLCRKYTVSKEIVAWQTLNSEVCTSVKTLQFLRRHVSRPEYFWIPSA